VEVAGYLETQGNELPDSKDLMPDELRDKLDHLLKLLFEFLRGASNSRESNAQEIRNSIWECLSTVFDKTLLKAHKARYLPFLIFYHAKSYSKYS